MLQYFTASVIMLVLSMPLGCARTTSQISPAEEIPAFPPYAGEKIAVHVVDFGVSKETLEKYPELREKRVGMGLCSRLVEAFYESGYFELVEEKEEMKKRIMEHWLEEAVQSDAIEEPKGFAQTEFLVYAEVYDFGTRDCSEVKGLSAKHALETWVTIQVRAVLYSNGKFEPASASGRCLVEKGGSIWGTGQESFDTSCVGKASEIAVRKAIVQLVERLKEKGLVGKSN